MIDLNIFLSILLLRYSDKGENVFQFPKGEYVFRKLKPQRPTVIRMGDVVKVCYYYKGTKTCLGPLCFWPKVGKCSIYAKLKPKITAK